MPQDVGVVAASGPNPSSLLFITLDTFQGPLDQLLDLVRTHKLDIVMIPIAQITRQGRSGLISCDAEESVNLETAGEFLVLVATLLYIKSRALLPPEPGLGGATDDDEAAVRFDLAQHLIEYQQYKEAAEALVARQAAWQLVYTRPMTPPAEEVVTLHRVGLADLLEAFKAVLEHAVVPEPLELARDEDTVERRCVWLLGRLGRRARIPFADLFSATETRLGVITTFLALLELIRRRLALAVQDRPFGSIFIIRPGERGTGRHA